LGCNIVAREFEYSNINLDKNPEMDLSSCFKISFNIENTEASELLEISPLLFYDLNHGAESIQEILDGMQEIGYPCEIKKTESI
jgi:hypothetical protein